MSAALGCLTANEQFAHRWTRWSPVHRAARHRRRPLTGTRKLSFSASLTLATSHSSGEMKYLSKPVSRGAPSLCLLLELARSSSTRDAVCAEWRYGSRRTDVGH